MLEDAAGYLEDLSPAAARRLTVDAIEAAESLALFPDRGRYVPELRDLAYREIFVQKHRLIYEVTPQRVAIVAFVHGARDFRSWWKAFKHRNPN